MRVILFFSFLLFLTGCGDQPEPPVKYITSSCPKLKTLPPIKNYPKSVRLKIIEDGEYYKVPKKQLKKASTASQQKSVIIEKQRKYIRFYQKEIQMVEQFCKKKRK